MIRAPDVPRTVVVTGASAGVGRAVAQAYAARGDRLALIARGRAGLDGAEAACRAAGAAEVHTHQLDVGDAEAVQRAADRIVSGFGGIDVWINDAFVSVFAPAWEIAAAEYRRVNEVNYLGTVHGTLAALRHMRAAGHGTIVQVGAALAYRGIPLQAPYCASKHAIRGFNDSLRAELLRDCPRVTLSMVQLPAVNTPQFSWVRTRMPRRPLPVPPVYQPEVAAKAVLWAADHGKREVSVGGASWLTRLGDIVAPALLDRLQTTRDQGHDAQQVTAEINLQTWQDNVDGPVDDGVDHGTHGIFDDRAKQRSAALWLTMHKPLVATTITAGLGLAALTLAAAANTASRRPGRFTV